MLSCVLEAQQQSDRKRLNCSFVHRGKWWGQARAANGPGACGRLSVTTAAILFHETTTCTAEQHIARLATRRALAIIVASNAPALYFSLRSLMCLIWLEIAKFELSTESQQPPKCRIKSNLFIAD